MDSDLLIARPASDTNWKYYYLLVLDILYGF